MIDGELPWPRIERLFAEWTGIDLHRGGTHTMLGHFIRQRVNALKLSSYDRYLALLTASETGERQRLIDAATVGLTWFFRDDEQLEAMSARLRSAGEKAALKVWIAGCASGEDVYSVAMIADELGCGATILGTDINAELLARAADGRYGAWTLRSLPAQHGRLLRSGGGGQKEVVPRLRERVRLQRHNLLDAPPLPDRGPGWDLILCRNVLIYFEPAKAAETIARLVRSLADDGMLLLGASEMTALTLPDEAAVTLLGTRHALRRRRPGEPRDPLPPIESPAVIPVAPKPARRSPVASGPAAAPTSVPMRSAPSSLHELAHEQLAAGRLDDAIRRYRLLLEQDPLSTEALMFLGVSLYRSGNLPEAAHALRGALFLDADLWPAAFYLGSCHDQQGQVGDAAREYRRVVECADRPLALRSSLLVQLEAWRSEVIAVARDYLYRRRATSTERG